MSAHTELPYASDDQAAIMWHSESADAVREVAELALKVQSWEESGRLDVDSRPGRSAVTDFLRGLHELAGLLQVEAVARTYHGALSERVRKTWINTECPYNVHITTKAVHGAVYFNSVDYPLSNDAKALGDELCTRMDELVRLLQRLGSMPVLSATDKAELQSAVAVFDISWASFEERFFLELPNIEIDARSALSEAVDLVSDLDRIASNYDKDVDPKVLMENPEFFAQHNNLIQSIGRLSSVASRKRHARMFEMEVLQRAETVVEDTLATGAPFNLTAANPTFTLSSDAVLAWDDLCCYLYQMTQYMEWFNPDLSKNAELVRLLAAWESSWELATTYVLEDGGRMAMCALVRYIVAAKVIAPSLANMLEDRSAELFMVLPRLVWLSFLEDPLTVGPLILPLLPHRFQDGMAHAHDPDLVALMDDFKRVWNLLATAAVAAEPENGNVSDLVQAVLTGSVVVGVSESSANLAQPVFDSPAGRRAKDASESFVRKLESWSMELQRHHAENWNRFSAIVMRCVEPQAARTAAAGQ